MKHTNAFFAAPVLILMWIAGGRAQAGNSVLSNGYWLKLRIAQSGVYAISQKQAQAWGLGNLGQVSIWGNGCAPLPEGNDNTYPADLRQIPSAVQDGALLFFAEAGHRWQYSEAGSIWERIPNPFSEAAYIYVTNSQPRIDIQTETPPASVNYTSNECDCLAHHERNDTNLLQSGRRFWGEAFGMTGEHAFAFDLPNAISGGEVKIQIAAAAGSAQPSAFEVQAGGGVYTMNIAPLPHSDAAAIDKAAVFSHAPHSGSRLALKVAFQSPDPAAAGFLDFIVINARCRMALDNGQMLLRDAQSAGQDRAARYEVQSRHSGAQVWDVSNIHAPKRVQTAPAPSGFAFAAAAEQPKTFAAFTPSMAYTPVFVEKIPPQDLRAQEADYIIIAPPSFAMQAGRLAKLHNTAEGLRSAIVAPAQIYNEFSSGIPDPAAIRNYLKTLRQQGHLPKYVLLFGSGSYINMEGRSGAGLIPTYQSVNSLDKTLSFVSDDYFALLDEGETLGGNGMTGQLDLAVGRLPAANASQASVMAHKIEQYYAANPAGWANRLVMIADDGDNNIHASQTEDLCQYVQDSFPVFELNKIYLDQYPQAMGARGKRFPEAAQAIGSAVNAGALLINYAGHANTQWLAHEQVLTKADIAQWTGGGGRLPLFVTATCEFSRFDNPWLRSAGESVLFKANGGGIAMLSTTRLVYSSGNAAINREFMRHMLGGSEQGQPLALGEMVRRAKNGTSTGVNQLNFILLGDPALRLHLPADTITSIRLLINGSPADTLRALDRAVITGGTTGGEGDTIEIAVYDKPVAQRTLGNGGQQPFEYSDPSRLIYRGRAAVSGGEFSVRFVVPKDINLAYGQGRITFFGKKGGRTAGGSMPIIVGGVSADAPPDNDPPQIWLYMDTPDFVDGGATSQTPLFVARIADESGINLTGEGIGRTMTLHLPEINQTYILNQYYTAETDSTGTARFRIPPLPQGRHTAEFRVFDVYNNSAESSIRFVAEGEPKFRITRLYNYPNPFDCGHTFFYLEHNRPDAEMDIEMQIFALNGALLSVQRCTIFGGDTRPPHNYALWDGTLSNGAPCPAGIYIYKVSAKCRSGERAEKTGKLLYLCTK